MADSFAPAEIGETFRAALTGAAPPTDLLHQLGGWDALAALAPTLVDDPLLTPAVSLLLRNIGLAATDGEDLGPAHSAAAAVADAVLDSTDAFQFAHNLDAICADPIVTGLVGPQFAARVLTLAVPPSAAGESADPSDVDVLRHAISLEAVARLAVRGQASKHKVLGVLEDITEPQPRRYAQAVVRTVGLAFDHWAPEDEIADVIDVLTGISAPVYTVTPAAGMMERNEEYRRDIGADAAWAKANVEVARALRGGTPKQIVEHLDTAIEALTYLNSVDERDDAKVLDSALRLLRALLLSLEGRDGPYEAAAWDIPAAEVERLSRQAAELEVGAYGLNHWSGDRKLAVLQGWNRLARDLVWLRDQLDRDSLYEAAMVLDDILSIYSAARSYDVTRNNHGVEHVLDILRPAVAGGFAARAGLLRNLSDHVADLRRRIAAGEPDSADDLQRRLTTAESVLNAARMSMLATGEPPGKSSEQAANIPPLLEELLRPHTAATDALSRVDPAELAALAADIADRQAAADPDPDLVVTAVRKRMLAALSECEDFAGEVVAAATAVLDQLIKFVARRLNTQESSKGYLFSPDADEHDLHADLYDWLSAGPLGSFTNVEVQEVGAGRVDIQIQFSGFHLYLELKADHTAVPIENKAKYIKQTVSYQAADVRIGFLVVLRMTPPKDKGPSPHLTDMVSHTTVHVQGSASDRHVVMLEVAGNQTKPSSVR